MRLKGCWAIAPLLLTACWGGGPVALEPITKGPDVFARQVFDPRTGQVFASGTAIAGGRLTVRALKAGSGERVSGARVTVMGPTLAYGTTSSLDLTLQPLEKGSYRVRIEAPGCVPQLSEPLTLDPQAPPTLVVSLVPSGGDVTGRALGADGKPLAGARISVGEAYAFADATGRFTLKGAPAGAQTLSVSKTGYATVTREITVGASEVALGDVSAPTAAKTVSFENATQTFAGTTVGNALSALQTRLTSEGFVTVSADADAAVRVVSSPRDAYATDATVERLRAFVAGGGKLVLMGEWGGFGDYSPAALNKIAIPYGLGFNADQVRLGTASPSAWVSVPVSPGALPTPGAVSGGLKLYEACSLFAPPPAVRLSSLGQEGYRVSSIVSGDFTVVAARPYGRGLVIALGDTSAWASPGTQGKASNLEEASNGAFISDLFLW
ncbi:MAG TPA: carboxypeptidase-like regulatory domain-containing protein [Pantanalinema sp.]